MLVHLHQHVCVCTKPAPGYSINNFFGVRPPLCSFGGSHPGGLSSPMCEKNPEHLERKNSHCYLRKLGRNSWRGEGEGFVHLGKFPKFPKFFIRISEIFLFCGIEDWGINCSYHECTDWSSQVWLQHQAPLAVQASQGVCDGRSVTLWQPMWQCGKPMWQKEPIQQCQTYLINPSQYDWLASIFVSI